MKAKTSSFNERMEDYLEFSLNDCFIAYATVKGQRLFFPKYGKAQTLSVLTEQYSELN